MNLKQGILLVLSYFMFFSFSCRPNEKPKPFEWPAPEPYEEVAISFGLPRIGFNFTDTTSICQYPNVTDQSLDAGGVSGFHYKFGISYDWRGQMEEVSNVTTSLHVRGLEEITGSYIPFETILDICENKPTQCFVRLLLKYQNRYYSNISYQSIPYNMEFNDTNASYNYFFPEVDDNVLDCFDNQLVQPIIFEYDGYIYTDDRQDSLKVENLESEFVIFEFY